MIAHSRRMITLGSLAILTACGGDGASGPDATVSVNGVYALKTINSQSLPVTVSSGPEFTVKIVVATLSINPNNTFSNFSEYAITTPGSPVTTEPEITCSGTYSISGNTLSFTEAAIPSSDCGDSYAATWDGANRITIKPDISTTAVFER